MFHKNENENDFDIYCFKCILSFLKLLEVVYWLYSTRLNH